MNNNLIIVTLDGPSGSGKGTIGQLIAKHYNWHYLDSGGVYRAITYAAQKANVDCHDNKGLEQLLAQLEIKFLPADDGGANVMVNGENISDEIRNEQIARLTSTFAAQPHVRKLLLQMQRNYARPPGLVADGRDMGSVVFEEADIKFYLTASAKSRAKRRYKQLKSKGFDGSLTRLVKDIQERDFQDTNREHSPLKPAQDAIIVDTTTLTIEQVFKTLIDEIDKKR